MAANNDDATKQIFSRCLLNCLQIPLWYIVCIILFMALAGVLLVVTGLNRTFELKVIVVCICSELSFSMTSVSIYYGTHPS